MNPQGTTIIDKTKLVLNRAMNWLNFSEEIAQMVDKLNQAVDEPKCEAQIKTVSHPGGFRREFGRRRLSIAEAYIIITRFKSPEYFQERLQALRILVEQSLHSKALNMPLNTARVQIALMKEAVKAHGNRRLQMEHITDFGLASFGQEAIIRGFLKKLHLIEVPEIGKPLKELALGWDDHVHDSLSEGRKSPTQVLMDAFVKGMSRLTLVYSTLNRRTMREALQAGEILGIKVEIGFEFSVGKGGQRRHYMYVPPRFSRSKDLFKFLDKHEDLLKELQNGLKHNRDNRYKYAYSLIRQFNEIDVPKLNEDYNSDHPCYFAPLTNEEFDKVVASGQPSREHLSELLFERFQKVLHRRVLLLKTMVCVGESRLNRGVFSQWELDALRSRYEETRNTFTSLSKSELATQYLASRMAVDYDSAFATELPILVNLRKLPGKLVLLHPLEMGLKKSMTHILKYHQYITNIETLNLRDSASRNPSDIISLNKFISLLNNRSSQEVAEFLQQFNLTEIDNDLLEAASKKCHKKPIIPNCGSDSTGRSRHIPGMGFIRSDSISPAIRKTYTESHVVLPQPITHLFLNKGRWETDVEHKKSSQESILCMGKQSTPKPLVVGDEDEIHFTGFIKFWRYLNPTLKKMFRFGVGFAVAMFWMYNYQFDGNIALGTFFASLWLFITFFRNILVDLIASSGSDLKNWSIKNINFDNAYQSVFWTGFSVPVLGMVKYGVDFWWPTQDGGIAFEAFKFFFICFANGLYISFHNRLRNFDKKVIRVNFFRSILSWPFATAFAPVGNAIGIPSIVQAKFWSDVVAGLIEGAGKFNQRFALRKRDLNEILPKLRSEDREDVTIAMLDILYVWARAPRGKTCLKLLLLNRPSLGTRIWHREELDKNDMEKKGKIARANFDKLYEQFGSTGTIEILTKFALNNFSKIDAVELIKLISDHSDNFYCWLKDLKSAMPD